MAVIYGWTYVQFTAALGWDIGAETAYLLWENFWAYKIEAYVFISVAASPRFTDANEILEIGTIINEMMVQMNLYLKGESVESPMETGFYTGPGFPEFIGDPDGNEGRGTGHFLTLNKYKRKYSELRVASFRIGVIPSENPFYRDRLIR